MKIRRASHLRLALAGCGRLVALACCMLAVITQASAETLDSSIADTRMTLAFRVAKRAAQEWLPAPWKVSPLANGPFKGTDLLVVSIDRLLHQDAKRAPKAGGSYRMVVLVIPAKNLRTGEKATFVARVYTPHGGPGPYKNSLKATVRRQVTAGAANVGAGTGTDEWAVDGGEGGVLQFHVEYERAVPKRIKKETRFRSTIEPEFFRIYRYEQLIDIVKSAPKGIDRVRSYQFRATIPELEAMFDGTEQLLGIGVIPWYTRQTFLP